MLARLHVYLLVKPDRLTAGAVAFSSEEEQVMVIAEPGKGEQGTAGHLGLGSVVSIAVYKDVDRMSHTEPPLRMSNTCCTLASRTECCNLETPVVRIKRMQFDQSRFYEAVDRARRSAGLSSRQLAAELGLSASTFSRLSQGRRPDVDTFVKLLAWLDQPAENFMTGASVGSGNGDTVRDVATALRQDPALSPGDADALEEIVRVAYHRLRRG